MNQLSRAERHEFNCRALSVTRFPFGLDWSTGLHDIAPIQGDDWFRIEPYQNFSSPNFSCPFPLKPQRVFSEPCIPFVELSGLLYSGEVSCRSP